MKSRKSFLLRINPDLYEALESWASQELRSINGQIEFILKEAVRKHGRHVDDNELESEESRALPGKNMISKNMDQANPGPQ